MSANPPFRVCSRFRLALLSTTLILLCCVSKARAGTPSLLFARGYTVIPEPQQVDLDGPDFIFGNGWQLVTGNGVQRNAIAVEVLREGLASRHGIELNVAPDADSNAKVIRMAISPGSVNIGVSADRDKKKLADEAYRLDISPSAISITANAEPGLLYGAETLVQICQVSPGRELAAQGPDH
jgi:hexosaminidase